MNENNQTSQTPVDSAFTNDIVSVNSRGSTSNDAGKKIAFIAVVLAFVIVGGLFGLNKYRAKLKAENAEIEAQEKNENKAAAVGQKKTFDPDKPPQQDTSPANDTTRPKSESTCKEIAVVDASGKPLVGKDGQAIKVGCDGKVVPAIEGNTKPNGQTGVTTNQGQGNSANGQKKFDRYDGDVIVSTTTNTGGRSNTQQTAQPNALDVYKQILEAQQKNTNGSSQLNTATQSTTQPPPVQGGSNIPNQQGGVGGLLTPTTTPKVTAAKIGDRNMLLAKGSQIDCGLSTKIVNEVSGFASCVLSSNIYSDNGRILLLERGSEVTGEYVAQTQLGQRSLFVLWNRIKTPSGVVIALDSPAASELGTMGIAGYVDNRWWDRLGAAFMLSFIKDAISYQIAKDSSGSSISTPVYQNTSQTGERMAERILAQTINIKPTIYKNQGDRASIYVARDLDFSTVYALRAE